MSSNTYAQHLASTKHKINRKQLLIKDSKLMNKSKSVS
jgi:hypothetical protein